MLQFGYEASFKNTLYWKVHLYLGTLFKNVLESWKGETRWRKYLTGDGSSGLYHFWPFLVDCQHLVMGFGFYILCYIYWCSPIFLKCMLVPYAWTSNVPSWETGSLFCSNFLFLFWLLVYKSTSHWISSLGAQTDKTESKIKVWPLWVSVKVSCLGMQTCFPGSNMVCLLFDCLLSLFLSRFLTIMIYL